MIAAPGGLRQRQAKGRHLKTPYGTAHFLTISQSDDLGQNRPLLCHKANSGQ
jgi:hypothetical protein